MILIVAKFTVKPAYADEWLQHAGAFTRATRAEPGNLWFEWSRSLEHADQFTLVEAFRDGDAGADHVNSEHFKAALRELPAFLVKTPSVINVEAPGDDWSVLAEMTVPEN